MFESLNELVFSAIVVVAGGVSCLLLGRLIGVRPAMSILLFSWHTAFSVIYSRFVLLNGGDAFVYYQKARFDFVEPSFGTDFVVWLTSFAVALGLTYWPIALLFNLAGALGLVFFYAALQDASPTAGRSAFGTGLILLCSFIPSISFWTSGIGKDALAFLCVGAFLWAIMNLGRRYLVAVVAVMLMLLVRPHIGGLMIIAAAAGTLILPQIKASSRLGIMALAAAAAVVVVPLALVYSGSTQFETIGEYIGERQEQNLGGGSSVDVAGMNPAMRLLSFLYRPLPNEADGVEQLAASFDNLLLIALTVIGFMAVYRAGIIRVFRYYSIPLIYGLLCLAILSQVTANLGLASRQKWMLVPALMLVVVGAWRLIPARRWERLQYAPLAATRQGMP